MPATARPHSSSGPADTARRMSARPPSAVKIPPLPELTRLGLIATLLGLAIVGWAVTDRRMAGMDAGPGTDPGALGFFVTTWVVMMAAMMFPSIAPMVFMYARIQRGKRERRLPVVTGGTPAFVVGYLITWTTAGLGFYGLIAAVRALDLGVFSWNQAGRYVAGGVIAAAGLYQLTRFKMTCLTKCRDPFMFLLTSWRAGRMGALRMGIDHGFWCVGCCWVLMAALFALGVMSIGWMAFIAALIAIEKLLPWKLAANRGIAVVLLVLGVSVAAIPDKVPSLTVPATTDHHPVMIDMHVLG
jgi:predicted metal-binding membrane protein